MVIIINGDLDLEKGLEDHDPEIETWLDLTWLNAVMEEIGVAVEIVVIMEIIDRLEKIFKMMEGLEMTEVVGPESAKISTEMNSLVAVAAAVAIDIQTTLQVSILIETQTMMVEIFIVNTNSNRIILSNNSSSFSIEVRKVRGI